MRRLRFWQDCADSGIAFVLARALAKLILHILTNGQYGFHRDELATLDDAHYLPWGYVAYPPLTPFLGRLAIENSAHRWFDMLGPAYGLPRAISGMNSHWLRGYGDPPPSTLIVVGMKREDLDRIFAVCVLAGRTSNRYGIANSTIAGYDDIFICRRLRKPWPEFWRTFRYYG